jgi:hypothetical protein
LIFSSYLTPSTMGSPKTEEGRGGDSRGGEGLVRIGGAPLARSMVERKLQLAHQPQITIEDASLRGAIFRSEKKC